MNKAIYKLTFLLSLAALLAACSRDDDPVTVEKENPDAPQFTVTRSTGQGDGELATVFMDDTEVGLSVRGNSTYANMKYAYRGGTLYPAGENIVWERGVARLTVDAYYPYRSDGAYTNPSVLQDQSTESNYYASDALICAAATVEKSTNKLSLTFKHRTAKMIFTFAEDVGEVSIANQALTQGGIANNVIKAYKETARKWKACIIPGQTNLTVRVKVGKVTYEAGLTGAFSTNKQYSYAIKVPPTFDLSRGSVTVGGNGTFTIYQSKEETTGNTITISGTPTVTIVNLNIETRDENVPLRIASGSPTIILKGNNTLKSSDRRAGLQLGVFNKKVENASVTIEGDGTDNCSLTAIGKKDGAGIGTPSTSNCGDIIIRNCTVTAYVVDRDYGGSAGIGSGGNSICGNITIENATVTATGNDGGAGIGSAASNEQRGECGNIIIKNSTIAATGGSTGEGSKEEGFAAAIGCGTQLRYGHGSPPICGNISITLKRGQTKDNFLDKLTVVCNAEKVGRSWFEGKLRGTVGTITWHDSDGNPIQ